MVGSVGIAWTLCRGAARDAAPGSVQTSCVRCRVRCAWRRPSCADTRGDYALCLRVNASACLEDALILGAVFASMSQTAVRAQLGFTQRPRAGACLRPVGTKDGN